MFALLLGLHLVVCLCLVAVILVQSGKGGGLAGGAFGGATQTVFGGRGATDFMTRATMVLGGAFFVTSMVLALMTSSPNQGAKSLIQEQARRAPAPAPAVPGSGPAHPPAQQSPAQPPASTPPATQPSGGGK